MGQRDGIASITLTLPGERKTTPQVTPPAIRSALNLTTTSPNRLHDAPRILGMLKANFEEQSPRGSAQQ